ncbi:MAG: pilus assembly protein PilM [Candidatus Parcubacteria bacterium]|nr:pilus assembly protein PilM [Candidatus Parcubacteria bacterium]
MGILNSISKKFNNKFPLVGVDISDLSIEFFQLQSGNGKKSIKASSRLELPAGLIIEGQIKDKKKVAELLKSGFDKGGFSSKFCLLSIPDKNAFFIVLNSDDDIGVTQIYSMAQESLPIELGQYYYDFIFNSPKEVLFIAAQKDIIRQYLDIFTLAELSLEAIDFESACLVRALLDQQTLAEPVFIVDLGGKSSDIILADKQGIRDQVNFAIGGFVLSEKIAEALGIDFNAAEERKKGGDLVLKGADLNQVIEQVFGQAIEEIKQMAAEYKDKKGVQPRKIILVGGTSLLKEIEKYFSDNLPDYKFADSDLNNKIDFKDKIAMINNLYANVIGLAIRGQNIETLNQGINLIKNLNN